MLSSDEFDTAYSPDSSLKGLLNSTFENDPIVFLGCRLKELVMPRIFAICKDRQRLRHKIMAERGSPGSSPPPRYIFLANSTVKDRDGKIDQAASLVEQQKQEDYYKDMDISPIWYPSSGTDHSALLVALERLANLPILTADHGWQGGTNAL